MEKIKLKKRGFRIIKKSNILLEDRNQILKRLEIIKSSIALEDEEIIEFQIIKLKKLEIDNEVKNILKYLQNSDFSTAIRLIENYLSKYSGIVEYIDPQIQGLKLELKSLEEKLQNLVIEKTEYLNDIEEFNTQYNIHLGDIIKSILSLKKEILYKKTIKCQKIKDIYEEEIKTFDETTETISELKETISELEEALENIDKDDENYDEIYKAYQELQEEFEKLEDELYSQKQKLDDTKEQLEDDELFNEYEDVKSAYDEFENEYEHIKDTQKDINKLNDDEKVEIKKLYKKAARLCHPDIVSDELKEKAHEIMQSLNDAYSKKDIKKVKEILLSLKTGTSFEVSSKTIEDKELLKQKIREYKQNIENLKSEIDEIKEDETYQTIVEIDDWDEYFEELKNELEIEKERLKKEVRNISKKKEDKIFQTSQTIKEEIPEWMQVLWDWVDEHNIINGKFSRKKENLLNTKILDFTNIKLNYLPKEIINLENLQELILWGCELKYLPEDIIKLDKLKKLNLRGNPNLRITTNQAEWLAKLSIKSIVFKDKIGKLTYEELANFEQGLNTTSDKIDNTEKLSNDMYEWIRKEVLKKYKLDINYDFRASLRVKDESKKLAKDLEDKETININLPFLFSTSSGPIHFAITNFSLKEMNIKNSNSDKNVKTKIKINREQSSYSTHIQSIENIKFEKIRKYCENLVKEKESDEMQKHLGEKGKMYKALMYSALEVFLENLNGETIILCDWECSQGIASMLVLDYIKEKQLDIKVSDVILIDDDTKALSRAMIQVEALTQYSIKINAVKSDNIQINDNKKNNIVINLFINDKIPTNFWTMDYEFFDKSYFLCVSNENKKFVDKIYENINSSLDVQDLSILDGKIGRFKKYERIFEVGDNEIAF